jgi:hypothetical protein
MLINDGGGSYGGAAPKIKSMSGGKAKTAALRRKASVGKSLGKAVARSVRPKNTVARRSSSSSSRSSGSSGGSSSRRTVNRSSGGGGGGGGGGSSFRPKPAPKAPSLASYLGTDSVYQQSVRGGKRSLTDFLSELGRRRGEAGTQFNQTKASMERDRTQQLDNIRQEFASRGLIQSGLFGEEQGKFQQQFTEQSNALNQQQTALLNDLLGQEKNYRRENDLATEQAKQEALMRRAQKYKIG